MIYYILYAISATIGAAFFWYVVRDNMMFQVLRMCVAGMVCFAGFAAMLATRPIGDDPNPGSGLFFGIFIGGIGLAMLLRIMCEVLAAEIHDVKQDSGGTG